ncbi:hypothetical protein [Coxiella-like endosymbiont]|nr:hypothetical protein [Coxiella-like endosymbiont]
MTHFNYASCLQRQALEKPNSIVYRLVDSQSCMKQEITYARLNKKE